MKQILYIFSLLFSLTLFSQEEKVFVISESTVADRWTTLSQNWCYQKGDNLDWARPEFDDSEWDMFSSYNLNMPDNENAIAEPGEIAWFRIRIMADSTLNKTTVLQISQEGASEIYLDGKLIHQLGTVSSNNDEVVYYNPDIKILQLPLQKGKAQVLAVRYANAQEKLPLIQDDNGYIGLQTSSLSNASSSDREKNSTIVMTEKALGYYNIAAGIGILIFIIFLSYFLFFPKERINGIFALSTLFLLAVLFLTLYGFGYHGPGFWLAFFGNTCALIWGILTMYCLYSVLEHKIDFGFKMMIALGILIPGLRLVYDPGYIFFLWAILLFINMFRICIRSRKKNPIGSTIFITTFSIWMVYLIFYSLYSFGIFYKGYIWGVLYLLSPISFMLLPVSLAIYLGLSFGKKSQQLRLNLERVQSLSKEKEAILSQQKVKLEQQVKERTNSLNTSLENLKATQSQLIQSEKMASLGELTAGIAHEIQNPLNFVNNFSEVSSELIDEMKEELDNGDIDEAKAISDDLKQNLEKIAHHGKRADSIVKGMLQHSRTSGNKKEITDINALADEYMRLAYHGLRAKDKSFNAELVTDFDENIGKIKIIPQDIGRVILNLLTNAFYACAERSRSIVHQKKKTANKDYKPRVSISTKKYKKHLEITVIDNGKGIPDRVRDKIFQPFFTTKPTGEGTGLGLSMSYDIITKGHGGDIKVESKEGEGTKFIIQLPINTVK